MKTHKLGDFIAFLLNHGWRFSACLPSSRQCSRIKVPSRVTHYENGLAAEVIGKPIAYILSNHKMQTRWLCLHLPRLFFEHNVGVLGINYSQGTTSALFPRYQQEDHQRRRLLFKLLLASFSVNETWRQPRRCHDTFVLPFITR